MNKEKVFIFSSVHRWDDTRIFHKMAISLGKKYKVELHAPAEFTKKRIQNVDVIGLPKWKKKSDRLKIHPILLKRIIKSKATIFHFHDPELIPIGILTKLVLGRTVIYDVHEDYPKQIASVDWLPNSISWLLGKWIGYIEKFAQHALDHIIVVTKPIAKRFVDKRTTIIYNFPFTTNRRIEKWNDGVQLVYIGNLREDRGIRLLCHAFQKMKRNVSDTNVRLIVGGELSGSAEFNNDMRILFEQEGIHYKGLIPYDEAMQLMSNSHIGIIPSHYKANYFEALPNKLFEYMQNELLVITTDIPLWESIVIGNHVGYTFRGESAESLSDTLTQCILNMKDVKEKASRGKVLAEKRFSWDSQATKLFHLYENLLRTH